MTWTTETIAKLTRLVAEGHTSTQVERLMPGFSRNAIVSKVRRLPVEWATPQVGGTHGPLEFPPDQRAEIITMLGNKVSPTRISEHFGVARERVFRLMAAENIQRPKKLTARGRPRGKEPPLPPLPLERMPMIVDVRQAPLAIPRPRASNVVALPVSGVRTCQFIEGSGRPWTTCGERVAWLGCSWCGSHARTVFARHPMIADAAD